MKNWSYTIVLSSIAIIAVAFFTGKVTINNMLEELTFFSVLIAMGKTLIVSFLVYLAIIISFPALIIDLVLLIFSSKYFLLIHLIWDLVWQKITLDWYWNVTNGSSLVVAAFILAIITHFSNQRM